MKKIKLISPAGNFEKLTIAINSGADAVFLGGRILNMRAGTHNFSDSELEKAVEYCKEKKVDIYVTLNAVPQNNQIEELPEYVKFLEKIGVTGVIISDLGVFQCVKENSDLKITVNTHSSNTNWQSIKMWKKLGATRVVLDREISLDSIIEIKAKVPDIEIEVFIHGVISLAVSARPLLKNYIKAKKLYKDSLKENLYIVEETRPGEEMPIFEDVYGTYIFGARDLCSIEILDKILDLGIDAIKIDGGMRNNNYLETVIRVYKEAKELYEKNSYNYNENWLNELKTTTKLPFINWYKN